VAPIDPGLGTSGSPSADPNAVDHTTGDHPGTTPQPAPTEPSAPNTGDQSH
jgi:hypothetical protein